MTNCKSCGLQMLFMRAKAGKEYKTVTEDSTFGTAGQGKCWRCFRKTLRNGGAN